MGLTDQAIDSIKEMIVDGRLAPGDKLPKEHDLAEQLGLSRNSLREAVRALSLLRVLEARQGDGTYVTYLEPSDLLSGTSLVAELFSGLRVLELHQVRRLLEPAATAAAASRLTDDQLETLGSVLSDMQGLESIEEFVDNDLRFHEIIVDACGNASLASLIKGLSGRTQRARIGRAMRDHGATGRTFEMHQEIYAALCARDPGRAEAAQNMHLFEVEMGLRKAYAGSNNGELTDAVDAPVAAQGNAS